MKILAIDLGSRKCGLALAQESFIFGRGVIAGTENWHEFVCSLGEVIKKESPGKIVVGVPHSRSGEAAERAHKMGVKIGEKFGINVDEVDETLTSAEAQSRLHQRDSNEAQNKLHRKNNKEDDEEAAKIILEDFLKKMPNDKLKISNQHQNIK